MFTNVVSQASQEIKVAIESLESDDVQDDTSMMV